MGKETLQLESEVYWIEKLNYRKYALEQKEPKETSSERSECINLLDRLIELHERMLVVEFPLSIHLEVLEIFEERLKSDRLENDNESMRKILGDDEAKNRLEAILHGNRVLIEKQLGRVMGFSIDDHEELLGKLQRELSTESLSGDDKLKLEIRIANEKGIIETKRESGVIK